MTSRYMIQIVDTTTGQVVNSWHPGLAVEKDLITELVSRVGAKGVGIGRTTVHVQQDVADALGELMLDLKKQINPL